MFARIFGWSAGVRRAFGLGGFLLALVGGLLAIWAAVGSSGFTLVRVFQGIMGFGAMIAGRRIYRSSLGILVLAGLGLPGILVLAAGLLGFVGAAI